MAVRMRPSLRSPRLWEKGMRLLLQRLRARRGRRLWHHKVSKLPQLSVLLCRR